MIVFFVSRGHEYTLKALSAERNAPRIETMVYDEILLKPALVKATYVFTDLDRLSTSQLVGAARLYRRLKEQGCRVLNDPAKARTRFALLRGLYLKGSNPFNIHLADEDPAGVRFPVFIRVANEHAGPLTDLIGDQVELEAAIEAAIVAGVPRSAIAIVEYAAEPIRPGVYRKGSIHRVGEQLTTMINWHGGNWIVAGDQYAITDDALYAEELNMVRENRYADEALDAFEFADIEYGRMDFGIVDGRLCVYEINTNPTIYAPGQHSSPQRMESTRLRWSRFLEALHAIDTGDGAAEFDVQGPSVEAWDNASRTYAGLRVPGKRLSAERRRRSEEWWQLSEEKEKQGDEELTLRYAEKAVAANPNEPSELRRFARALRRLGRTEQAVVVAREAVELSAKQPQLSQLAWALLQAGRYEEAHEYAEKALALGPERWENHKLISEIFLKSGATVEAHRSARRAAELSGGEPDAGNWWAGQNLRLAKAHLKEGRTSEARECLQEAVKGKEATFTTYRQLVQVCLKLGDFRGALRASSRALFVRARARLETIGGR